MVVDSDVLASTDTNRSMQRHTVATDNNDRTLRFIIIVTVVVFVVAIAVVFVVVPPHASNVRLTSACTAVSCLTFVGMVKTNRKIQPLPEKL